MNIYLLAPRRLNPLHLLFFLLLLFIAVLALAAFFSPSGLQLPIAAHGYPPPEGDACTFDVPFDPAFDLPSALDRLDANCAELRASGQKTERNWSDAWDRLHLRHILPQPTPSLSYNLVLGIDARAKARVISEAVEVAKKHCVSNVALACRRSPGSVVRYHSLGLISIHQTWEGQVQAVKVFITGAGPSYRVSMATREFIQGAPDPDPSFAKKFPCEFSDLSALRALLRELAGRPLAFAVVIDFDDSVTVQQFVDVWDTASAAKVNWLSIPLKP